MMPRNSCCLRSSRATRAQLGTVEAAGHDTQPPSRYTEASLVAKLEELRVGRPSTYASIMGTIQAREYVWKKGTALVPSFKAFAVITLLEQHFPDLVDYAFTARMEDDLDSIAEGVAEAIPYLRDFYFGIGDEPGLHDKVNDRLGDIDARAVNSILVGADEDGVAVVARVGRYGPYLEHGEDRASIPEDLPPADLTLEKALELIKAPKDDRVLGQHPDTGLDVEVKAGRFGPYVQMGDHDDETGEKPLTASLFKTMEPAEITLEQAVKLLTLPRLIGTDPADGGEITAYNGRYGPYIQKAIPQEDGTIKNDSRSLDVEEDLLTIDLPKAVEVMAQPKRRRGQGAAKPPLKEMGIDPASDKPMVLKEGRFGPYVTDGETNASLRKGDEIETLTDERASELLADRRAKGPAKKKEEGHQEEGHQEEGDQEEGDQEEGDQEGCVVEGQCGQRRRADRFGEIGDRLGQLLRRRRLLGRRLLEFDRGALHRIRGGRGIGEEHPGPIVGAGTRQARWRGSRLAGRHPRTGRHRTRPRAPAVVARRRPGAGRGASRDAADGSRPGPTHGRGRQTSPCCGPPRDLGPNGVLVVGLPGRR